MPRGPNEKVHKAKELYDSGMKLVEIASQLNIPPGTVRRWKSTYKWNNSESERSNKKNKAVADEVKDVMVNNNLTDKQQLFCIYYIRCFNATKAYQKAYGCSYESAMSSGCELLRNTKIKDEIFRLKQEKLNREFFSEDDIFQKYMDIAFADIKDYMMFGNEEIEFTDEMGNPRTAVVSHVNVKNDYEVDGTLISEVSKGKDGVKIKLADRMKALRWLSDHMDLATEEQRAKVAILKAKVDNPDEDEDTDDGFISALNESSGEDWSDE